LGKKSNKKNRFNITTPVETYKFEFLKNANLTFYRCVLDSKNLFTINQQTNVILPFVNEVETKYNLLPLNPQSLLEITLKEFKFNLLEINKIQKFKKPFLFVSGLEDPLLKENILKKTQPLGEKKQKPGLMDFGFTRTKT
jgi:hypothetical protein